MQTFKEKIHLAVIGFILTSVLGSGLTYLFTYLQWKNTMAEQRRETKISEAHEILLKTMDMCQNRFYASERLIWACEAPQDFDLNQVKKEYRDAVRQWNLSDITQRELIGEYLGTNCATLFVDDAAMKIGKQTAEETSVHTAFYNFQKAATPWLRGDSITTESPSYKQMLKCLQDVGDQLRVLYQAMLDNYSNLQSDSPNL
jgi:hypothetical protein